MRGKAALISKCAGPEIWTTTSTPALSPCHYPHLFALNISSSFMAEKPLNWRCFGHTTICDPIRGAAPLGQYNYQSRFSWFLLATQSV